MDSSSLEKTKNKNILIWSVGQLGRSNIRIGRILDPVQKKSTNLSRWGTDIRDMAAATESWRPKRKASLRLQTGQNHRPESLVKITCNYRYYIRKISKQAWCFWLDRYPTTNWAVYYAWNVRTWHTLFFSTAGFWVNLGVVVGYFKAFATDGGIYNSISIPVYVKKHTLKNH